MYQQRDDSTVFKRLPIIVGTPKNSLLYKNAAAAALFNVNIPKFCAEYGDYCSVSHNRDDLNAFSQVMMSALTIAVNACSTGQTSPRKFPWSAELAELKAALLQSHQVWVNAGRPRTGLISNNHKAGSARYKKDIRAACVINECKIND